jgi:hypothetical protein
MCTQSVGLIAGAIERAGIATVCIALLREVAEKVRPPRALAVPFAFGYPLGQPHDAEMQKRIINEAFGLLGLTGPPPLLASLD